jgi:hypothetical protein
MAASEIKLPPGYQLEQGVNLPPGYQLESPQIRPDTTSSIGRFIRGQTAPIDAGAQMLSHWTPRALIDALDYFPSKIRNSSNPAVSAFGNAFLADPHPEAIDAAMAEGQKKFEADRGDNPGIDLAGIAGNILSPANLAIASKVPVATTLGKKLLTAAGAGAAYGALTPVTDEEKQQNFEAEKAKQAVIGAAVGAAANRVGAGMARVIKPETSKDVQALIKEGITPTPGQMLGGRWQVSEDKLQSLPILGDAIASSRTKGLDELNKAAYARALDPIGGVVPKTVGREAVADVGNQISNAYNELLPKVQFKADGQFAQDLSTLKSMADNLPPEQAARFARVLKNQVIGKMTPQGAMDGQTLKGIESDIGSLSKGLMGDASFDNRQLGAALGEIQSAIRSNLERSNPDYADALKAANTAWANFARIRSAAGMQGAEGGKFSAAQLSAAVRSQDKSVGKGAFAKGEAFMQDLSDPAKAVLASKYPDPGTAGRLMLGAGIGTGTAWLSPIAAIGGAAATLPYLPVGRSVSAALMSKGPIGAFGASPESTQFVADSVRRLTPYSSPALVSLFEK